MTNSWDKKRTLDAYLGGIPSGLRRQMKESAGMLMNYYHRPKIPAVELCKEQGGEFFYTNLTTSPDEYDGHTHTANLHPMGNGKTSFDNAHNHDVVSFIVVPTQTDTATSKHPGKIVVPDTFGINIDRYKVGR